MRMCGCAIMVVLAVVVMFFSLAESEPTLHGLLNASKYTVA